MAQEKPTQNRPSRDYGWLVRVFVREPRRGLLTSVCGVLVLSVQMGMRVTRPVAVTVFVIVLDVLVGMGMGDAVGVFMLVGMLLLTGKRGCHPICIHDYRSNPALPGRWVRAPTASIQSHFLTQPLDQPRVRRRASSRDERHTRDQMYPSNIGRRLRSCRFPRMQYAAPERADGSPCTLRVGADRHGSTGREARLASVRGVARGAQ